MISMMLSCSYFMVSVIFMLYTFELKEILKNIDLLNIQWQQDSIAFFQMPSNLNVI